MLSKEKEVEQKKVVDIVTFSFGLCDFNHGTSGRCQDFFLSVRYSIFVYILTIQLFSLFSYSLYSSVAGVKAALLYM